MRCASSGLTQEDDLRDPLVLAVQRDLSCLRQGKADDSALLEPEAVPDVRKADDGWARRCRRGATTPRLADLRGRSARKWASPTAGQIARNRPRHPNCCQGKIVLNPPSHPCVWALFRRRVVRGATLPVRLPRSLRAKPGAEMTLLRFVSRGRPPRQCRFRKQELGCAPEAVRKPSSVVLPCSMRAYRSAESRFLCGSAKFSSAPPLA